MKISIWITLLATLPTVALGLQLEIINRPTTGEGTPVTVNCFEDDIDRQTIGEIKSLAIETIYVKGASLPTEAPSIIRKRQSSVEYVIKPLVKLESSGRQIWGEGFDLRTRSTLTGSLRSGSSILSLRIRYTTCSDNLMLMCVAVGTGGSVDSNRKSLYQNNKGFPILGTPVIRGGLRCPSNDQDYNDRCDVYASVGDSFDLRCLAEVGLPVGIKGVSWYLGNMDIKYDNDRFVTSVQNGSSGECNGNLISTLKYRHMPKETESEVVITCTMELLQSNSELSTTRSAKVTVCYEGSGRKTYAVTDIQMAGLVIAGFLFVIFVIVIILLFICCCGRKIKVSKRNKLDIAKIRASEIRRGTY